MADRFTFTKERLDALKAPRGGRLAVHDTKTAGLILRVTPTGAKTFSLFRRVKGGEPFRVTLGRYGAGGITIDQARRLAGTINAKAAEGVNVAEVKRATALSAPSVSSSSSTLTVTPRTQKRTWLEDRQRFEQYLAKPLGKKKLSAINRPMIGSIHSTITNDGHPVVANRVLALVSSIFGRAIEWGLAENNPAKGIRRNRETSRARFLQADELPRFFEALATEAERGSQGLHLTVAPDGRPARKRPLDALERHLAHPGRVGNPANQERYGSYNPTVGRGGRRPSGP